MDDSSIRLFGQFQGGDDGAADELFQRSRRGWSCWLSGRISPRLGRRLDAEDVVQSVYRSFFQRARAGRFVIEQRGDLWRLLVTITINKIRQKAEFHTANKRHMDREQSCDPQQRTMIRSGIASPAAGPMELAAIMEEVDRVSERLTPEQRDIMLLRLQGYTLDEIAEQVCRSERTVRRVLEQVRAWLQSRLDKHQASP